MHQYYNHTCPDCGGYAEHIVLSETENENLKKAFNKLSRWVFDNKKNSIKAEDLDSKPANELTTEINKVLQEAVKKGIEYEVPQTLLDHIHKNVYVFSGAKTYAELRELSNLLVDNKGELKSFSKFYKETRAIHNDYNKNYLESEYLFAQQSAIMASKWADIENDGDRYNLQYRTANDDKVRKTHQLLHNITLPPSDTFWNKYFPPNGWRCRCNVVQVRKKDYPLSDSEHANQLGAQATMTIGKDGSNTSEMFRFNPGKQQIIFPNSHPYFREKNIVDHIVSQEEYKTRLNEYNALKKDANYIDVERNENAGLKATHINHTFHPLKGHYEKEVQDILFENGQKIILESEMGDIGQKHFDALMNEIPTDIKAIEGDGKNTIKRALQKAKEQGAQNVVLYFTENEIFSIERLHRSVAAYNGQTKHRFKDIYFIVDKKVYKL